MFKNNFSKKNIFKKNKGIATLTIVLAIGMMALAVVVSITAVAFNELIISQGTSQSSNALFYAESGARDALIKIARDKTYTCDTADCYSINFVTNGCTDSAGCAKVSVSTGTGVNNDPKIITSKGIMKSSIRTIQVKVTLDDGSTNESDQNGQITSTIWEELTD